MNIPQHRDAEDRPFRLLRPSEVQVRLAISRTTLYRLVGRREIAVYRVGRVLRFKPEDVEACARRFDAAGAGSSYGNSKAT